MADEESMTADTTAPQARMVFRILKRFFHEDPPCDLQNAWDDVHNKFSEGLPVPWRMLHKYWQNWCSGKKPPGERTLQTALRAFCSVNLIRRNANGHFVEVDDATLDNEIKRLPNSIEELAGRLSKLEERHDELLQRQNEQEKVQQEQVKV